MCYGLSICRFKVSGFPCFCKMMNYPPMRIYNQCKSLCIFIHQPSVLMLELVLLILQLVLNCNLRQKPPVFFPCLTPQNSHKGRRHEHEPSTCPPPLSIQGRIQKVRPGGTESRYFYKKIMSYIIIANSSHAYNAQQHRVNCRCWLNGKVFCS